MTSSVPARIEGGTVRPSALAVLRLTTSSNRHRAGEKNYEIASPHARPLALTASRDYGSKGPPRIGWAKDSFAPNPAIRTRYVKVAFGARRAVLTAEAECPLFLG